MSEESKTLDKAQDKKEQEQKCEEKDIQENKFYAVISYFWILFLIPILVKKDSQFAIFHAKQGLALFVLTVIYGALSAVPFIGWFLISWLGAIIVIVLFLIGIINALQGQCKELPVIGGWFRNVKF